MKHLFTLVTLLLLAATPLHADEAQVRATINKIAPSMTIENLQTSAIKGFYEVLINQQVVYVSEDGKYLIQGRIIDLDRNEDIAEPTLAKAKQAQAKEKKKILSTIEDSETIIFAPKEYKYTLTAFTDIDCPYCVKLHREIDQLMAAGIRVRYLFFPRAGLGSDSHKKSIAVWCSDNRQEALTLAKNGQKIPQKECDNPIANHMRLVHALDIRGTPAIFTESGEQLGGYLPADQIAAILAAEK